MTSAAGGIVSQYVALATYSGGSASRSRVGQYLAMATYGPGPARDSRVSQMVALATYNMLSSVDGAERARLSQMAALVVWGATVPVEGRQRCWAFVLDGHWFYVMDMGQQGTFAYDTTTNQWSNFATEGHVGWNMRNGCLWDVTNRPLGADSTFPFVWELVPENVLDEGFRQIDHWVTGGVTTRSRRFIGCSALRVSASSGYVYGGDNITFYLQYSDDNGNTWTQAADNPELINGVDGYSQDLMWYALGSFMAPGRVFQLYDSGGLTRIDGADVMLDNFDDEDQPGVPTGPAPGGPHG